MSQQSQKGIVNEPTNHLKDDAHFTWIFGFSKRVKDAEFGSDVLIMSTSSECVGEFGVSGASIMRDFGCDSTFIGATST